MISYLPVCLRVVHDTGGEGISTNSVSFAVVVLLLAAIGDSLDSIYFLQKRKKPRKKKY